MKTDIVSLLDDLLTELEAQKNLLRFAEEEVESVGINLDPTDRKDNLKALDYANRADMMLTLLYTSTDKASLMHEWVRKALEDCLTGKAE